MIKKISFTVLFLFMFLLFSCTPAEKPKESMEMYCGGIKTNQLVLKTFDKYVEMNWRYKLTMRVHNNGEIEFNSPNYIYPNIFKYIDNFPWDGIAEIPKDGTKVIPVKMPDGKYITVIVYDKEKTYVVNWKGIYNFKFGCDVVAGRSVGTAIENSKYENKDLFDVYPFSVCGP